MITLLAFSSFLLLIAPIALLIATFKVREKPLQTAPVTLLLWAYFLPAIAPIAICAIWRIPATRVLIELRGIAFRGLGDGPLRERIAERTPGSGRILIGDSARRRRPSSTYFGTLVFRKGELTIELPPPESRGGLVAVGSQGIIGAEALEDGDRVCIDRDCWTYDDRSFTNGTSTVTIESRKARLPGVDWVIPLPWATPSSATGRTYSLEALGNGATRLRSFFCYAQPGPELRLVTLDANVTLQRDGKVVQPATHATVENDARIAFFTLPTEADGFERPGIVERRSVRHRAGKQSFALDFDTPEIHSLTVAEFDALRLPRDDEKKQNAVALAMGDAQMTDKSLYFTGVSESVALQASSILELSRFFPRDFQSSFRIVSPRGPTDASLGEVAWIGATDLAAFRMDVLRPPLLLLIVGLALQFFKVIAAHAGRLTATQVLLAGAIEALVAVRLLVGYRVWVMPPHRVEGAELGILAWIALPWLFLAASVTGEKRLRIPAMAGLLFSAVFCTLLVEGPRQWVWIACHVLAVGVSLTPGKWSGGLQLAVLSGGLKPAAPQKPLVRIILAAASAILIWLLLRQAVQPMTMNILLVVFFVIGWFGVPLYRRIRGFIDEETMPFILISIAFCAVRFFLLLFGWKESVPFGGARLSLSAAYVPAAVILEGFFFRTIYARAMRNRRLNGNDLFAAIVILLFVWMIPAALTSDIGLALLNIPVFVFVLLGCHRATTASSRVTRHDILPRALPWVLATGVVLFVGIAPLWRFAMPIFGNEERMLERASDSNFARFIHFAEPERLRELATKRGESLAITSATLQRYISTGLTGLGYGRSEISPHLGDTALRDFAPAVFIAAEWGLAGTMAMLLLYGLFFTIGHLTAPWVTQNKWVTQTKTAAGAILYVATATIAVASIYMILANHELLLLTGKNAYLLGLDSAGDVLETIALLFVIAWAAAALRDETTRPAAVVRRSFP